MKKQTVILACVAALTGAVAQTSLQGALPGEFKIGENKTVRFSQGNLVYNEGTKTFSFADNQTDYGSYFGWGTSGYHDPEDDLNTHYLPTDQTIAYDATNTANLTGYGPSFVETGTGSSQRDIRWNTFTGSRYANYDWGIYNPIFNGGNQAGLWRTLTQDEWTYLLTNNTHQWVTNYQESGINGLLITATDGTNTVFLPAAGYRGLGGKAEGQKGGEATMHEENTNCNYWSASAMNETSLNAYAVDYSSTEQNNAASYNRFNGFSVRLVYDSQAWITVSDRENNQTLLEEYKTGESGSKHGLLTNVHLVRTLYSDGWNTLCLPFDVTETNCKAVFGEECQLYTFSDAALSDDKTDLQITLVPATAIIAGTPYIIQPTSDIVNPDFYNCIIKASMGSGESTISGSDLQFVGIINPYQLQAGDKRYLFVTAGNELNWSKAGDTSSMYGMRAYFYVPGMESSLLGVAKTARLVIAPKVPTGLGEEAEGQKGRVAIGDRHKYLRNGQIIIQYQNKEYTL